MADVNDYRLGELKALAGECSVGFWRAATPWPGLPFELWLWDEQAAEVRRLRIAGRVERVLHSDSESIYFTTSSGARYRLRPAADELEPTPLEAAHSALAHALQAGAQRRPTEKEGSRQRTRARPRPSRTEPL